MTVDFRKNNLTILDKDVEIVHTFKFLGTILSNDLKRESNVNHLPKKLNNAFISFGV